MKIPRSDEERVYTYTQTRLQSLETWNLDFTLNYVDVAGCVDSFHILTFISKGERFFLSQHVLSRWRHCNAVFFNPRKKFCVSFFKRTMDKTKRAYGIINRFQGRHKLKMTNEKTLEQIFRNKSHSHWLLLPVNFNDFLEQENFAAIFNFFEFSLFLPFFFFLMFMNYDGDYSVSFFDEKKEIFFLIRSTKFKYFLLSYSKNSIGTLKALNQLSNHYSILFCYLMQLGIFWLHSNDLLKQIYLFSSSLFVCALHFKFVSFLPFTRNAVHGSPTKTISFLLLLLPRFF